MNAPLILDYAPPHLRATAISINLSGLLLGITSARVLSGTISYYVNWSVAYYTALGLQSSLFIVYYLFIPDYPRKDHGKQMHYGNIILTTLKAAFTEPALVQLSVLAFLVSLYNISYWAIMAYLLDNVWHYDTLQIGLFGLAGLLLVICAPLLGRVADRTAPWVGLHTKLRILVLIFCSQYYLLCGLGICIVAALVFTVRTFVSDAKEAADVIFCISVQQGFIWPL